MDDKYTQLGLAIELATEAHAGQFDKGGKPYILHPLHLMGQLMFDVELATIAVLHDVAEDSDITVYYMSRVLNFSDRVTRALELLTHGSETYESYIDSICTNYDAIRVKRKDLEHNSQITRLKGVTDKDIARMVKYHNAFIKLGNAKQKYQKDS